MADGPFPVLAIHTSDRINFKRCRQAWFWASKLNMNLTAIKAPTPLAFGSAIHKGAEVWYDPQLWDGDREVVMLAAVQAFRDYHRETRDTYLRHVGQEALSEEMAEEYQELLKLGVGMLENYCAHSLRVDTGWKPVGVEVPFEIPIMWPEYLDNPNYFDQVSSSDVSQHRGLPGAIPGQMVAFDSRDRLWKPVVYRGRIDLIMRRVSDQTIHLWDHKTAARLEEDTSFLDLDEQMGSYGWAYLLTAGVPPHGIVYSELYKGTPEPPTRNKNQRQGRWFSVNKQQDTSYDLYLETVSAEDPTAFQQGLYDDMLQFLGAEGKVYFRRTTVVRNATEYRRLGDRIALEAIDMLESPFIYPNPTKFGCKWCMFKTPCLAS